MFFKRASLVIGGKSKKERKARQVNTRKIREVRGARNQDKGRKSG